MHPEQPDESERQHGLTRRTVLRAGAWATPVIAVAIATPAAAASGDGYSVTLYPSGSTGWSDSAWQIQGTRSLRMSSNNDLVAVPAGYIITLSWDESSIVHLALSTDEPSWPSTLSGEQGDLTLTLDAAVDSNSFPEFSLVPSVPLGAATGIYTVNVTVVGSADAEGDLVTQLTYSVQVF
ncbi:hypothetical protein N1027_09885 [Herbiconiux sp. CPCC 205763]|uniref:Tat pathway signal sequence domain protein n=1 Tax=Herbiconiux aconitum TaxID=2970913 RepID=A0ABT2GQE9_9MICO|nr:hypothetical protein [Herbiconiux aconitum]MCS5718447.1 hypothetical protein [Herbiconiux aconitum]